MLYFIFIGLKLIQPFLNKVNPKNYKGLGNSIVSVTHLQKDNINRKVTMVRQSANSIYRVIQKTNQEKKNHIVGIKNT